MSATPWDDPEHDVMKDLRDAKEQAEKEYREMVDIRHPDS